MPLLSFSLNLKIWQIGILMAFLYLPYVFSYSFSVLADKLERFSIVIFGLILSIFPLIMLSIISQPLWIGILSTIISLSMAIIQPANLGIVTSLSSKKERSHLASLEIFFQRVGIIFGAIILGYIGEKFSLQAVFLIMAILSIIFSVFAIAVKWHSHKEKINHKHNLLKGVFSRNHVVHHAHFHS